MMAQYFEIKAANPDCLLFYRMGDFYELFFDDAEVASRALGIVLTKRGKHEGEDIRMCGVPIERADDYLNRLIALGHRVAVCEQLEDPAEAKKRGAKSVVSRDVVRLVTPGTITEERLLEPGRARLLVAVQRVRASEARSTYGLAALDLSTGAFSLSETDETGLAAEIARLEPSEIVAAQTVSDEPAFRRIVADMRVPVTPLAREAGDGSAAERRVCEFYGVETLDGFGAFTRAEIAAAALALAYVRRTQFEARPALSPPTRRARGATLEIDPATRANLELTRTLAGARDGSLLATIDLTVTPAGARLLAERLASPLTDPDAINERLDCLDFLVEATRLARSAAPGAGERARFPALAVAAQPRSRRPARSRFRSRRPRRGGGGRAPARRGRRPARGTRAQLRGSRPRLRRARARSFLDARRRPAAGQARRRLRARGRARLPRRSPEPARRKPPRHRRHAGGLRRGDRRQAAQDQAQQFPRLLHRDAAGAGRGAAQGRRSTRASSIARRWPARCASPPTRSSISRRRSPRPPTGRSRSNSTPSSGCVRPASPKARPCAASARRLAEIDVAAALAELAVKRDWTRPLVDASLAFAIERGRHPVVEAALKAAGEPFVANDCDLSGDVADGGRIAVVTGPNMAGKSTYLRQNALIALIAQMGSYVPAARAHVGVVDRLFSRVGAADDLARGRSTFMVEMVETAAILNQATHRSLVILDEIGRGTATFDGLSIAYACVEHLNATNRSRALFATHFHELTQLAETLPRLVNLTMRVSEFKGSLVFLHEVVRGAADRSYGIQVAKLAGLPASVVKRARKVLADLEASRPSGALDSLPLFSYEPHEPPAPSHDALREALAALDPDAMSPREAHAALYALKRLIEDKA